MDMNIEYAINRAQLWAAGKMVGGDEDEVRNALLHEVKRLRALLDADTDKAFMQKLTALLKSRSAEIYYTTDDDGIHIATFGDDIYVGFPHGNMDGELELLKAAGKLDT